MSEPVPRNEEVAIANTSTRVSERMTTGKRQLCSFVNTSATAIIYMAVGAEAVVGKGYPMNPGGFWIEDTNARSEPSQLEYNFISNEAAGSTLAVHERIVNNGGQ